MLAFNLWFVEPCSPKTLGISAISFVISGATCVIGAALENGLVQPFWVTSIVVVVSTSTFSRKRLPKKNYCEHRYTEYPACQTNLVNPHFILTGRQFVFSPMLPRICSLFTCHIETIKRKFSHCRKHGMYSIYYLTSKRMGNHSTELNGLEKLLKHQHVVGKLAAHCKTLNSGLSKKYQFFYSFCFVSLLCNLIVLFDVWPLSYYFLYYQNRMLAFNLWIVEPCSPKTLGISAISFVVSGATCVIGVALFSRSE